MICEGECLHFAFDGYSIGNHFDFWLKGISMREKRSARDVNSWEEEMTMALWSPLCLSRVQSSLVYSTVQRRRTF